MVEQKILLNYIRKIVELNRYYLASTLRYERYRVNETSNQWISLLGQDVCLLTHADTTAALANKFISYNTKNDLHLTAEEELKMQIAPLIHDWGEIIIEGEGIGDITFEQKNSDHEIIEIVIFNKVVSSIKEEIIKEKLQKIYLEVVMDRESRLGDMFNAIERLGYMQTALRAYKGVKAKRIKNWKGLVGNVLSNQIIKLLFYAEKYPYVTFFLIKNRNQITNMLNETYKIAVPLDSKEIPSFDSEKLSQSYEAWKVSHFYK